MAAAGRLAYLIDEGLWAECLTDKGLTGPELGLPNTSNCNLTSKMACNANEELLR